MHEGEQIAKKLGDVGWSVYASREYVERTGLSLGAELDGCVLAGQRVVGYRSAASRASGAVWLAEHSRQEDVVFTGDSVMAVWNAVKAGFGVSALPCFVTHDDPTLVRLTPAVVASNEAFLVIPPDHKSTVRVRLVMDAVAELFARERGLLEGVA